MNMNLLNFLKLSLLLTIISTSPGCSEQQSSGSKPNTIRVALLPDQNKTTVIDKHKLLFEYLKQGIGIDFELIVPADYETTLKLFIDGKVDIAYFGGATFVKAEQQARAVHLISRDIDADFTSIVLVNSSIDANQLKDLKGKSFSFGSKLSTSGHLMPRFFFEERDIAAETYFSKVVYSGAHDRTALMVSEGEVDAGVINSYIYRTMLEDGRLQQSKVKLIWHSPKYQDYVWAIQPNIDVRIRNKIRDSFMALDYESEAGAKILKDLNANYFIPVSNNDYEVLRSILNRQAVSNP